MAVKRVKKPKGKNVVMTQQEVREMKYKTTDEAVRKSMLLVTCAVIDELNTIPDIELPENFMEKFVERAERYSSNLKAHLFDIRDLGESIYKLTGVDWRGW